MHYQNSKMNKIVLLLTVVLLLVNGISAVVVKADDIGGDGYDIQEILSCINNPQPIDSITKNEVTIRFAYDDNNRRVKKEYAEEVTIYEYAENRLISERKNNEQISYLYDESTFLEKACVGFSCDDRLYWYEYDEEGRINYILDGDGNYICRYVYNDSLIPMVYEFVDIEFVLNENPSFVGNRNPLRYCGWYYDQEIMCYYLGGGIYYDAISGKYINNEFSVNREKLCELFGGIAKSTMPDIVNEIISDYTLRMGSPTFLASSYNNVSEAEWKKGKRWYDGLDETEVVARCIYGENNGEDRKNDRIAEAVVIANRVAEKRNGRTTAYGVVTDPSKFSTINPGSYAKAESETYHARRVMNKNESRTQEALLLAVTISHTVDHSEMKLIYKFPEYIEKQTEFLGLAAVKKDSLMSVVGNQWYYGSNAIKNVVIAGEVLLSSPGNTIAILESYSGYNVFFNYGTGN